MMVLLSYFGWNGCQYSRFFGHYDNEYMTNHRLRCAAHLPNKHTNAFSIFPIILYHFWWLLYLSKYLYRIYIIVKMRFVHSNNFEFACEYSLYMCIVWVMLYPPRWHKLQDFIYSEYSLRSICTANNIPDRT